MFISFHTVKINMKKLYLAVIALTILCLFGCTTDVPDNDDNKNNDSSDIVVNNLDAKALIIAYMKKLNNIDFYESSTTGQTKAKKGFITYNQDIVSKTIKNNDQYYYESNSKSAFVNLTHKAYFSLDKVRYMHNSDEVKEITMDEYRDNYGFTPCEESIGGYIVNEDTIISCQSEKINGNVLIKFQLDSVKSAKNMQVQMKEFGSLSNLPTFNSISFELTLDSEEQPISLFNTAEYKISVALLGEMNCVQNITTIYNFDYKEMPII